MQKSLLFRLPLLCTFSKVFVTALMQVRSESNPCMTDTLG